MWDGIFDRITGFSGLEQQGEFLTGLAGFSGSAAYEK